MPSSILQLKSLWNKDKEYYLKSEVGTGVQSFVKKFIESPEIFYLKEGKLSTKDKDRKNEFIYEKHAKENRKADFYIYINADIAIPIEAECYGNLKAGEKQLINYQKDFGKKYGILTDGFTWKFYNNTLVVKEFTLEQIFKDIKLFLNFWREYVKPEFYYLSFFEKFGQLALTGEEILPVEKNRQLFFEDITKLIENFQDKLQIEGYLEATETKSKKQRATELTYAYVIQFILYKTLVDNDFDNFAADFNAIVSKVYQSLKQKQYKDVLGAIDRISATISKNIYRPFSTEQNFIKQKIDDLYRSLNNNLSDVSPWLDTFVFIKRYNFANVRNEIFGFIYENYLKALYEESKKGQYFTDPAVVNFMLEQIGYTPENIKKRYQEDKNSISIIDPSCGSGTFLYSSTDAIVKAFHDGYTQEASKQIEEVITNNVFGLDIEEFPLYLAEMSILMRLLPLIINEKYNNPIDKKIKVFKTRDSIAEFMDTAIRNTLNDMNVDYQKSGGQLTLFTQKLNLGYPSYVRDEDDLKEMKQSLENHQVSRRRFDFVIGNPPYIPYNECSKQKILTFNYIKSGGVKLNNIYGINLHSIPGRQKKYAPKPNFYAFFIALGLALLKDNGKLSFIIPQTILTAGELDVLRYHLSKFTTIEKIITFSGKMFLGRGLKQNKPIATSSLVFVVSRTDPNDLHETEIVNYYGSDQTLDLIFNSIRNGKKINNKRILQTKLFQNLNNWNFITKSKSFINFYEEYKRISEAMFIYYDHVFAQQKFGEKFYFDGSFNIPTKDILQKKPNGLDCWKIPNLKSERLEVLTKGFYPKSKKIKIAQGSQGMIMLNTLYKVIWRYANPDKFFFIQNKNILPRFQQFCIASNNKNEIFYLLTLLNSSLNSYLLENLLISEGEKDCLIGLSVIKEFIRVPLIGDFNKHVKEHIIKLTDNQINMENIILSKFVDFSKIMIQRFNKVLVKDKKLVLEKSDQKIELPIKGNTSLVTKVINENFSRNGLGLEPNPINLSELISLPVIDFEKQKTIKDLIDDLIFCLYFNIYIPNEKIENANFIKAQCQKNKFYKLINK